MGIPSAYKKALSDAPHLRRENAELKELVHEYRAALGRIADSESGHWGRIAREALRGERAA